MNLSLYHRSPWMTVTIAEIAAAAAGSGEGSGGAAKGYRADIRLDGPIGQFDYGAQSWKDARRLLKEEVRKELAALAEMKVQEIHVEISSLGGSFQHALAIHDWLAQYPGRVVTRVVGMTASAATVIAQAGHVRRISANALYLIHRAGPAYGYVDAANANELRSVADTFETFDRRMSAIYAKRSGTKEDAIWAVMQENGGKGQWMTADRAKSLGLVDEIFEPMDAAASAFTYDLADAVAAAHLPPLPGASRPPDPSDPSDRSDPSDHRPPEQTKPPVTDAASVAAGAQQPQQPKGQATVSLTATQIQTLEERFGAAAALAALKSNAEYAVALEQGALAQAKAIADLQAKFTVLQGERDAAIAKATAAEAAAAKAAQGLADPLAPSDPKNPPADPKAADAKAKAEAEAKADAAKLQTLIAAANAR